MTRLVSSERALVIPVFRNAWICGIDRLTEPELSAGRRLPVHVRRHRALPPARRRPGGGAAPGRRRDVPGQAGGRHVWRLYASEAQLSHSGS